MVPLGSRRFRLNWLGLLVAALASGCRGSVGSSCSKGDARCLDANRELVCEQGHYIEVPCRKACSQSETGVACDVGKNQPGDRCSRDEEGAAVCLDAQRLLACHDGTFQPRLCHGANGCRVESGRALCDTSRAELKEACAESGKKACSLDGKSVLACDAQQFAALFSCRGEKGCEANGSHLECDQTVAELGDPCDARLEGHIACNVEHTSTLVCHGGKFAVDAACKKGTSCEVEGKETRCAPVARK